MRASMAVERFLAEVLGTFHSYWSSLAAARQPSPR
jgi:hypothetical protein